MDKNYVAIAIRLFGNSPVQNPLKTDSSSTSSTSSLSYSPGSIKDSPLLSIAYGIFDGNETKIFQMDVNDFYEDLRQVGFQCPFRMLIFEFF